MMKYKREATLFKTARFPIRGLITNGLMIPINRSDTPSTDQIKREQTFVEKVGKGWSNLMIDKIFSEPVKWII